MEFEWDEVKRRSNLAKHGVDFTDAAQVLAEARLILEDTRCDYGEQRCLAFGEMNDLLFVWHSLFATEPFASSPPAAPTPEKGGFMNRKPHKKSPTRMTLREAQEAGSQTDWLHLRDMPDEAVTSAAEADPDNLPLDDPFFETARRLPPSALLKEAKQQITLRIDADVLEWFRASGSGYQSRMNAVLKAYVQTHSGHGQL